MFSGLFDVTVSASIAMNCRSAPPGPPGTRPAPLVQAVTGQNVPAVLLPKRLRVKYQNVPVFVPACGSKHPRSETLFYRV